MRQAVIHLIAPGPMGGAERAVILGVEALRNRSEAEPLRTSSEECRDESRTRPQRPTEPYLSTATEEARTKAGRHPAEPLLAELWVLAERRSPEAVETFLQAAQGLKPRVFSVERRLDLRAAWALARALRKAPPAWLHAHGYKALALALLARPRGVRLAVTAHGPTQRSPLARFYESLERVMIRQADALVTVSEALADSLKGLGLPTRHIPNAMRPSAVPPAEGPPVVGFLGRLSAEKAVEVLLDAVARLEQPPALLIVGDGPEREALEARAQRLGLAATFAGFQADVTPYLAQMHLLALPSLREGLPLAVLEALAAGRPVVGSAVGGVPAAVGPAGVLVAPGDVAALTDALAQVLGDWPRFAQLAAARGEALLESHGEAAFARALCEVYGAL